MQPLYQHPPKEKFHIPWGYFISVAAVIASAAGTGGMLLGMSLHEPKVAQKGLYQSVSYHVGYIDGTAKCEEQEECEDVLECTPKSIYYFPEEDL